MSLGKVKILFKYILLNRSMELKGKQIGKNVSRRLETRRTSRGYRSIELYAFYDHNGLDPVNHEARTMPASERFTREARGDKETAA